MDHLPRLGLARVDLGGLFGLYGLGVLLTLMLLGFGGFLVRSDLRCFDIVLYPL